MARLETRTVIRYNINILVKGTRSVRRSQKCSYLLFTCTDINCKLAIKVREFYNSNGGDERGNSLTRDNAVSCGDPHVFLVRLAVSCHLRVRATRGAVASAKSATMPLPRPTVMHEIKIKIKIQAIECFTSFPGAG